MKNPRNFVDFIVFVIFMRLIKTSRDNKFYLDVEQEVHHVTVFNDVVFTF